MRAYTLTHLSDAVLLRDLAALLAQDRLTTAALLAHIAEVDARKLYLPAAYPSMYSYCVGELHMSEDAACRRIRAARAARQFPDVLMALAEGRLHLTAVVMLAPYLTPENAEELLEAAAHQDKSGIERLLAERFPQPAFPTRLEPIGPALETPGGGELSAPARMDLSAPGRIEASAPGPVGLPTPGAKLVPLAPERFSLQITIDQGTHDKLRYAQALLGHALPSGDLAQVLDRALDALIGQLEKSKFAATPTPRPRQHPSDRERHVPAHVRRAVWARDGGRCTFVSESGHRCPERKFLEFDHVDPVARGGQASVAGIRLQCRAHNQYEAERTFGVEFMGEKREQARRAAAAARARAAARQQAQDVMAGLRGLGVRADEARRAAEFSETLPDATLEERMRAALKFICPKTVRIGTSVAVAT